MTTMNLNDLAQRGTARMPNWSAAPADAQFYRYANGLYYKLEVFESREVKTLCGGKHAESQLMFWQPGRKLWAPTFADIQRSQLHNPALYAQRPAVVSLEPDHDGNDGQQAAAFLSMETLDAVKDPHAYILACEGYGELARVLKDAFEQSARGKGAERHASTKAQDFVPFERQPILQINRDLGSIDGALYQVVKKVGEVQNLVTTDAKKRELYGAIVYAAAAVLLLEEFEGEADGAEE